MFRMINTLTSDETTAAVHVAFENLSPEDKAIVRQIAQRLISNMHRKYPGVRFGMDSALELLACMGMAINDNRLRLIK